MNFVGPQSQQQAPISLQQAHDLLGSTGMQLGLGQNLAAAAAPASDASAAAAAAGKRTRGV